MYSIYSLVEPHWWPLCVTAVKTVTCNDLKICSTHHHCVLREVCLMDPQPIELQNKQLDLSIHPIHRNQPFQAESQLQEAAVEGQESETRDQVQRVSVRRQQRVRANVQFFTLCWTIFLMGWNDGSTGPLVPRIREVYHVRGTLREVFFYFFILPRLDSQLYP